MRHPGCDGGGKRPSFSFLCDNQSHPDFFAPVSSGLDPKFPHLILWAIP
jgi:hypothetical protein